MKDQEAIILKNYNYNPVFTGIQPRINIDLLKEKLDDIYDAHYYIIWNW